MTKIRNVKDFIEMATSVHGDTYDYSDTAYLGSLTKLKINCKQHGAFFMLPYAHKAGSGCAECKRGKISKAQRGTQEEFLRRAVKAHGSRYDYSQVVYSTIHSKVSVLCREHGKFEITPGSHAYSQKSGCPRCASHGFNIGKPGFLYVIAHDNITKVGITNRAVSTRIHEISRRSGKRFELLATFEFKDGNKAADIETYILNELRASHASPTEIYDGSTESFVNVDRSKLLQQLGYLATSQQ